LPSGGDGNLKNGNLDEAFVGFLLDRAAV